MRELECTLGYSLLKPAGRRVALTEAGRAAPRQAEHTFQLGEELPAAVRAAAGTPVVRLAVGISESLAKLPWRRGAVLTESLSNFLTAERPSFDGLLPATGGHLR